MRGEEKQSEKGREGRRMTEKERMRENGDVKRK